jgi:antitoxin PrlF
MITSKLTTNSQTTIPRVVRAALCVKAGDKLAYQIDGPRVILTKANGAKGADDPFRTFAEWNSAADRKAYGKL